jgi:hypothetical protein
MTPAKMASRFIMTRKDVTVDDRDWVRSVFTCIVKVARSNKAFTVDLVWEQIDLLRSKGKLPKTTLDQRIIGPMMRFSAFEGLIRPSGYYKKSTRAASGYRPITVWDSAAMSDRAA